MNFQHIYKQIDVRKSVFYAWFEVMHTRVDIALCNLQEADSIRITEKIRNKTERINKMTDRFNPKSEISQINLFAANESFKISAEFYGIIEDCIRFNKETEGAFDITVNSKNNYRNGIEDIVLNKEESTVFFKNKNVQIDLCGYIKGYALDKIKDVLFENNCMDALVSLGNSSVLALGNHPNGKGWKVNSPENEAESITLFDECLTSSGNSTGHFHIINPKTGKSGNLTGVKSVVTKDGVSGEVLVTALNVTNLM